MQYVHVCVAIDGLIFPILYVACLHMHTLTSPLRG